MRAFFIVIKFELETMLRKKSFLISTVLVALGAVLMLSFPRFIAKEKDSAGSDMADKTMMLYDHNEIVKKDLLTQFFSEYKVEMSDDISMLQNAVKEGNVDAGFEIKDATNFVYYVKNSSMNDTMLNRFQSYMQRQYQLQTLTQKGYDAASIDAIYQTPITSEMSILGTDGISNYFYTYAMILLLYMMILIYGNQIGVSVASEKSNRAIEILTTSASSNALIFGKVIAGAITGVLQTAIMLGSFLIAYQVNADVWNHALDKFLQIPSLVLWTFALFGILGYLLFSFMFGAIGAMCSKVEEVNGATMPIQLLIIAVFAVSFISLQMPNTLFAKIVCYIPFTSWMCMFINVAVGSVSLIEIVISLLILCLTVLAMGYLGARLYRRGTLSYGNKVSIKSMIAAIRHHE